jgi:L-threonylcarbamoyladenylate synthase
MADIEQGSMPIPPPRVTTRVLTAHDSTAVAEAAAEILRGELIVLPTDTVYGVAANAVDEQAILKLYAAKQRSLGKAIPLLLADFADLERVAREIPAQAWPLLERFWPGPLTLIVPRHQHLPAALSRTETIAVRMPDHDLARAIIRAAGGALATTSANRSGHAPAQTAVQALHELAGAVTLVVDAGPCGGGVASTVLDCTTAEPRILRAGPLTAADMGLERG